MAQVIRAPLFAGDKNPRHAKAVVLERKKENINELKFCFCIIIVELFFSLLIYPM